ncbi:undecaprenyl-diphosphatase [Frankineae bacterium MT45]|nr:undecaprenyl-diphosphatase [Frankineae bacterium MT45]
MHSLVAASHVLASTAQTQDMSLFQAIVYGTVQGLTEFLPISSTAHLRIVPALFNWPDPGAPFTAVIQLGTTIAVVGYFWRELLHIAMAWFRGTFVDRSVRSSLECRMGWYLILATVPVSFFGLVFRHQIETGARNLWLIAITMIVLALIMGLAEKIGTQRRDEEQITTTDAIWVGTAQALALIPGASRSGTTITAGLFRGLDRSTAARFSFLLSIPAVVLSALFEARKIGDKGSPGAGLTGVATLIAFIVGLASIAWLMKYIAKHSVYLFVYYRIGLGLLLIGLLSADVISAT